MASQGKIIGTNYRVFEPVKSKESYASLSLYANQERLLIPNAAEIMNARISLVDAEKNLEKKPDNLYFEGRLQARKDWLERNIYTGDAVGRCINKVRIIYDCPLLAKINPANITKDGRFVLEGIKKFDILNQFEGSDEFYYEELALLRKRDVFDNLRILEVPLNLFWRAIARNNIELLESYHGSMVLEVQRENRLGIDTIMGIDLEDLADGEIRPIVMHGATYGGNADVSAMNPVAANIGGMSNYATMEYCVIGIEKHLPAVTLDTETWKAHAINAPVAGVVGAGLRIIAGIVKSKKPNKK